MSLRPAEGESRKCQTRLPYSHLNADRYPLNGSFKIYARGGFGSPLLDLPGGREKSRNQFTAKAVEFYSLKSAVS